MRGNLGAGAGPGNCTPESASRSPAHIDVHRNMMAVVDIIARLDRSDQKSELIV
jgi:hypothetical protein